MSTREEIQMKISEQTVLKNELATMKKGHRVYQQQRNSNVYFLADRDRCKNDCQKALQKLDKDLKALGHR